MLARAAYHGTPITPNSTIDLIGGNSRSFCVSFYTPYQDKWCDENSLRWFADNGMFSLWQQALKRGDNFASMTDDYIERYIDWCRRWCLEGSGRCEWAVIPDPIGTSTQELDAMLRIWPSELRGFGVPVYHLDEPIDRVLKLLDQYGRVCMGATAEYARIMSPEFAGRMDEVYGAIDGYFGQVMPTHFFRGLQLFKPECDWPIISADSADRARNHNRLKHLGDDYHWAFIQSVNRWDDMERSRNLSWPPERMKQLELI